MRVCINAVCTAIVMSPLGCVTSDSNIGSELPDSEVAIIRGASRGTVLISPTPVIIRQVDGRSVSGASASVRVSPGNHVLLVTCYESMFSKNTHELNISVDAGRTYDLLTRIDPNKISDGTPDCEASLARSDAK